LFLYENLIQLNAKHRLKSGFTLVELAIVLVIIGLLVGGVIQGQELIKQAKIIRFVSDINSYKLSLSTFQLKYNSPAGAYNQANVVFPDCILVAEGNPSQADMKIWAVDATVWAALSTALTRSPPTAVLANLFMHGVT
jgi:prepilin-type N-terminal cleavage/methylation domain-containing protein